MSQLSENLKNLRIMNGYSLKDIANIIDCAPTTVANWEKGQGSPKAHVVELLCKTYNITPNQLMGFESYPALDYFIDSKKEILAEIKNLEQQKSEIEKRLRMYHDMFYQKK